MRIYTVGYGSDLFDGLMARIAPFGITHLVDVRTYAWSRYQQDFRGEAFADRLRAAGLKYVFMGNRLGGRPSSEDVLTDGEVDYAKLRNALWFLEGVERLLEAASDPARVLCLMCGCGKPEECHRGRMLCDVLENRGCSSVHILPDGSTITQTEVQRRLGADQLALFD